MRTFCPKRGDIVKIIHLISGGDTGGAKTHVLTLLDSLRKKNIEVELLCIMEGIFTDEARQMGIPVTIIPQTKRWDISAHKRIKDFINSSGCDLVHCHGARANYIAMFIMGGVNVPMITTLHSDYKLDFKGNLRKQLLYTPINAIALRRFKGILTVTEAFKNMLISRGFKADRLNVIYNGVEFDKPVKAVPPEEFMRRVGLQYDPNKKYVGIAARMFAVKGVEVFLRAAERLVPNHPDTVFLVLGDGELMPQCKAFVEQNNLTGQVKLLGQIYGEELMNSYYTFVDVNTLTSYSESFPYALLEGARCKCATVATAVGGIPEMIEDGVTGFLAPSGDDKALADKIGRLLDDDALRKKMGESFYAEANRRFSAESMADTHIKIYNKYKEK
jgi:glycosyltransferase involved in cell wall biosynthesis